MNFDLVKIDQPNSNQIVVRQMSQTEKKQMNRTSQCPKCGKMMTKKTLRYSHKCGSNAESVPEEPSNEQIPPPEPQPELIQPEPVKPEPKVTDDDVASYIQRLKRTELETRLQKRKDRVSQLFSRAV